MCAKFGAARNKLDGMDSKDTHKGLNVHEEYLSNLRTKSYVDFCSKVQMLVNQPSFLFYHDSKFNEVFLEDQETTASIIDSAVLSKVPELKGLMLSYFEISAEASKICSHLLRIINKIQSNYKFIQQALNESTDDHSPHQAKLTILQLSLLFISLTNPFSNLKKYDFMSAIRNKYSPVLDHLKATRRKVVKKSKLIRYFNKASILRFRLSRNTRFLSVVGEQLDIAAKGTYILNRDFETMSRLVGRLDGEMEHKKEMIKFCLERGEDKFSLQVVKELKKSDIGFKKHIEELEEHIYLCLVTIKKARGLVVEEIAKSCVEIQ